MSIWRRFLRVFDSSVEGVVGAWRVFGSESESLDAGLGDLVELMTDVARVTREHLRIKRVGVCASGPRTEERATSRYPLDREAQWFLRFTSGSREWRGWIEARNHGGVFALVNRALHDVGAPRRLHIVNKAHGGQDFWVALASIEDVQSLLDAGWVVDAAEPHVEHVLTHEGLRFFGHRPWRLSDKATVIEAVLAEDQIVHGLPCKGGTEVAITYEGTLTSATLSNEIGGERRRFRPGCEISFGEDPAEIGEVRLSGDHVIDGYPCRSGTVVTFQAGGALASLVLARDHAVGAARGPYRGRQVPAGSMLRFEADGSIESIDEPEEPAEASTTTRTVDEDCAIDGIPIRAGTRATFSSGRLEEATLAEDVELPIGPGDAPRARFAAGSIASFYSTDGALHVSSGTLAGDQSVAGIPCRGETIFEASSDGTVHRCTLAKPATLGPELPAGAEVWFDDDGRALYVVLPEDTWFLGFDALAGVCLELDDARTSVRRIVIEPR